jgi:putative ABC transport system permease protein
MGILFTILQAVPSASSQGILWSVMTIGVYLTFSILDYPDLTVDGSFALGGAVSAILIVKGMDPFLSLLFALMAGMLAGVATGLLHTKLKIPGILAGILSMIALYSINIRVMGKANMPLLGEDTIVTRLSFLSPSKTVVALALGITVSVIVIALLYWFFGTELGCCIRATGNNEYMVRALGGNTDNMKIIGLFLSNGLVALSGGMVAQQQGYADVGMGTGTIVIGLASVIIGEVVFGWGEHSFAYKLFTVVLGSIVYRVIIAVVLQLGLKSTDLKLLTAVIVAFALAIPVIKQALRPFFAAMKSSAVGKAG